MSVSVVLSAVIVGGGLILIIRRVVLRKSNGVAQYRSGMMSGKTVIITGANSGIGKATASGLFALGARVLMACRNCDGAQQAAAEIRAQAGAGTGDLIIKHLDLSSLTSVRNFCREIIQEEERIDVLINNAGVYRCPYTKTQDGFEMQLGVNHLGHFLLTHLLMDLIGRSAPSRIIVVSSKLYKHGAINFHDMNSERGYEPAFCYSQSKLANLLFTRHLSRRLEGSGVTVNALSPGMVHTNLGRHVHVPLLARPLLWLVSLFFFKSCEEGAETPMYLASAPQLENVTGKFFSNCREEVLLPKATDDSTAERLWDLSESMVGIKS